MESFSAAAAILPADLRLSALALPEQTARASEELRLRAGRTPTVTLGARELPLPGARAVTVRDLEMTLELATRASVHTALEKVRQGWFTIRGGCRIGLCGQAVWEDGRVKALGTLSSLNLRLARAVPGCAGEVYRSLTASGPFPSTLLLAPPGLGKTTLLRELVRMLSDGGTRVGLADERGEVAALWQGMPQFDVGAHTDILDGCPKAQALLMLLRGMNPQVLACDEITAGADCAALGECANCGVKLLATAHGADLDDLRRRPLYRQLLDRRLFDAVVTIRRLEDRRCCQVEAIPC